MRNRHIAGRQHTNGVGLCAHQQASDRIWTGISESLRSLLDQLAHLGTNESWAIEGV